MTDGIIQEVFGKHLSDKKIHLGDYLMCKRIQQELIEKIQQELYVNWLGEIQKQELLRKLIGDNNE